MHPHTHNTGFLFSIGSETGSSEMIEDLKQRLEITDAKMQDLISQNEGMHVLYVG